MKIIFIILFVNLTILLYSQEYNICDTTIYSQESLTMTPEPIDGFTELFHYISLNVKFDKIPEDGWCGYGAKVFIGFVIENDSSLTNFEIIKGHCPSYDNPILGVLKKMPKWKPGKIDGKNVRSKFVIPIHVDFK